MVAASLYITVCSAKNRIRVRVRRLREPRYLLGAIVGIAYFYFSFFARTRGRSAAARRRFGGAAVPPTVAAFIAAGPAFAGLALLLITVASWIVPASSSLLEFSEAEVQFLFPAPVPRRQLLLHRILRSQLGLLFASMVVAIATPSVAGYTRLRVSVAAWVLLVTAKIYFAGLTMARARLTSASGRVRRVAWMPIAVLAAALTVVVVSLSRAYGAAQPARGVDVLLMLRDAAERFPVRVVLWPFVTVARPLFSAWPQPYLTALVAALGVLAVTVVWVLLSDEAFQEAAAAAAERRAADPTVRAPRYRVTGSAWRLAPAGRADVVFAWKAALQTSRLVDRRALARGVAVLLSLTLVAVSLGRARGLAGIVGLFATVGTGAAILFFPQIVRMDLRQDLQHLDVLKTWPVAAASVVRGELLWPGAIITVGAWIFEIVALITSPAVFTRATFSGRLAAGLAIAIAAPALVFAQLTIHNAVALMFPAWVPVGDQRPRGLDAMGQRLIMLAGTWFLLGVMTLPGVIAGGIVWFAFSRIIGVAAVVPAATVCSLGMAIEVLLATEALGPLYERLDISAVERSE